MATKPKPAVVSATTALPTFVPFDLSPHWDAEADKPEPVTPYELEDADVMAAVRAAVAQYTRWREVVADPAEAKARQAHAEQSARYLVGIFPATRINADAYGNAAGEELAGYGGDIVKAVAQHVRRRAKSLPPISGLVDLAEGMVRKREAIHAIHQRALRDHADAIRRGKAEAQRIADAMATSGVQPALTQAQILRLWLLIVGVSDMGVPLPTGRTTQACGRLAHALFERLAKGNAIAANLAGALIAQDEEERAALHAASDEDERNAIFCSGMYEQSKLLAALPPLLGLPKPEAWSDPDAEQGNYP